MSKMVEIYVIMQCVRKGKKEEGEGWGWGGGSGNSGYKYENGKTRRAGESMYDRLDLLHKSHSAPVPYPIMHYFVTEMWTRVQISDTKFFIVGYLSHALWTLWDGSFG